MSVGEYFGRTWCLAALLTTAVVSLPVAQAVPVTYVIDFTGSGILPSPAQGVFRYDAAAAAFSNFLVRWDGALFDLTAEANAPSFGGVACAGEPSSSPAVGFALMSKTLPCAGTVYNWSAAGDTLPLFDFFAGGPSRAWNIADFGNGGPPDTSSDYGFGEWTIAAVGPNEPPPPGTVPEPPMISLVLAAMLLVGRVRRRMWTRS